MRAPAPRTRPVPSQPDTLSTISITSSVCTLSSRSFALIPSESIVMQNGHDTAITSGPGASAAAHTELPVPLHLLHLRPGPGEHVARLVVDLVETAVVTGVVVDGLLPELRRHREAALGDQPLHELRSVDDLVAAPELRKLVPDRVEAVGAVHDDLA